MVWKSHEDNCGNQLLHKTRNVAISALFLMTVPFNLVLLCSFNSLPIMIFISNYELLWRRQWHPTPILLPGKSHGQRSLVGCSPMGSLRVRHDWATSLSLSTFMHWRRKWQPTPVFLPGESQGRGSLVGCRLWGHTESEMTEAT